MRAVIVRLIDLILSREDLIVFCVIYDSVLINTSNVNRLGIIT